MCWTINKQYFEKNPEAYHKVADNDLTVYKIGYCDGEDFRPFYRVDEFSYKPNVLNEQIALDCREVFDFISFDEGYHSFSEDCYAKVDSRYNFYAIMPNENNEINLNDAFFQHITEYVIIGKFIIPAGTEYYIDNHGEIVSSQLIWTGKSYLIDDFKMDEIKKLNEL